MQMVLQQNIYIRCTTTEGKPNATQVTAEQYWGNSGKYAAAEGFILILPGPRIREASLSYELPKSLFAKLPIGAANIGVFGRNLWLHDVPNYPHLDPEQNVSGVIHKDWNSMHYTNKIIGC